MRPQFHTEVWKGIRITPGNQKEHREILSWRVTWKGFQCWIALLEECSQSEAAKQAANNTERPQACFCRRPALLPGHLRAMFVAGFFKFMIQFDVAWTEQDRNYKLEDSAASRAIQQMRSPFKTPPLVRLFRGLRNLMLKHISARCCSYLCL